jgi:hypothetical protein
MTKREVDRAAKKGPLAALDNGIAKWGQMRDALVEDLKRKLRSNDHYDGTDYCACCLYSRIHGAGCSQCPIYRAVGYCHKNGYDAYEVARDIFLAGYPITPVRKAIRTLIRNMKKARKIMVSQ